MTALTSSTCLNCVFGDRAPLPSRRPSLSLQPLALEALQQDLLSWCGESSRHFRSMRDIALAATPPLISFTEVMPVQDDEDELDRLRWASVSAQRAAQASVRAAIAIAADRLADAKPEAAEGNRIQTSILARAHPSDPSSSARPQPWRQQGSRIVYKATLLRTAGGIAGRENADDHAGRGSALRPG